MPVAPADFKDALSKFASGVTIVTVRHGDLFHGMTASAFASVSLSPPLVLVCLEKTSQTRALLVDSGVFAINILGEQHKELAEAFSRSGLKPFEEISHRAGIEGVPLVDGAIASIQCRVDSLVNGGDHDIVIGEVTACESNPGRPLVYFDHDYRRVQ